jgi:TolB-like protein/class 3 adenylate cyclase/Tfp pilus assembly protein PilF
MSAEVKKEIQLEIAHVLFIDIVGYSKLSINDQRAAIDELTQAVRASEQVQNAEAAARLIKIPTGDGMALVFYKSPEEPVECALEISRALKEHPKLQLRMGVHSGPVSGVIDVNGQANLAGAGLNMAQRVMDCCDAGHILLSKRVADDLGEYEHWRPLLHDLGECEVKHGMRVSIVNLHADEVGNPQLPKKFQALKKHRTRRRWAEVIIALFVVGVIAAAFIIASRRPGRQPMSVTEKSIAVLPFENLSDDKQNAYFADGVQDEILTDLAKIADLKVISRSSVMQYKSGAARNLREIGQQLGVANVLEGSVQRAANRVRINAQLIDARNDAHLWGQTYDRDLADVFAIQSEIAKKIANELKSKLSPDEKAAIEQPPTTDLVAFDFYTHAKTLLFSVSISAQEISKKYLYEAVDLLDKAVARDPAFASAFCLLAKAHGRIYSFDIDHSPQRRALAEKAVRTAEGLNPSGGETHLARARFLFDFDLNYEGAERELRAAESSLSNSAELFLLRGYIERRKGHWDESLRNMERAIKIDPRNFSLWQEIALNYLMLRRYPETRAAADHAVSIVPEDGLTRVFRAVIDFNCCANPRLVHKTIHEVITADPTVASSVADIWFNLAICERDNAEIAQALSAISETGSQPAWVTFPRAFCEGLAARVRNDPNAARSAFGAARAELERITREQPQFASPLAVLGMADAALGRKEEAIREGRRAVELCPPSKDAIVGPDLMEYLAVIYAWTGEKDLALEQLAATVKIPGLLYYGDLRLHPFWDPLRGDPRFDKIVASLAPK